MGAERPRDEGPGLADQSRASGDGQRTENRSARVRVGPALSAGPWLSGIAGGRFHFDCLPPRLQIVICLVHGLSDPWSYVPLPVSQQRHKPLWPVQVAATTQNVYRTSALSCSHYLRMSAGRTNPA